MGLTLVLTIVYLMCFQLCAWPAVVRICRRRSSADLSVWREWLILIGAGVQLVVMVRTHAAWVVLVSPVASMSSVIVLLLVIWRYRHASRDPKF